MQCIFYILNHFLLQVVDIVRTNVRAILQRVWRASEVDNLRLCRVFSRVFNRLLWSHGQGLWNCFSNLGYVALWVMYTHNKSNLVSRAFYLALGRGEKRPFPVPPPSQGKDLWNEVSTNQVSLESQRPTFLSSKRWRLCCNAKHVNSYIADREQGCRSGESARLPPMWPGFYYMWVEFVVGYRLLRGFFYGFSCFQNSNSIRMRTRVKSS